MAEKENTQNEQQQNSEKSTSKSSLSFWLILGAIIFVCALAGMVAGSFIAKSKTPPKTEDQPAEKSAIELNDNPDAKCWFYDIDPVTANLDEPSVTRYIRTVITLEISPKIEQEKAQQFIDEKKPVIKDWLTIYLASQSLEDIRGKRNLCRIKAEILDHLNTELFGPDKPYIEQILFKEFAIQ